VDHGDNVQQVVLAELLEAVGELLHIDVLVLAVLLLGHLLAAHAVCVGGSGLGQQREQLGLGIPEGLAQRQ
jgi:hypothetical protein